jgi:hypothetical protein
LAPPSGGDFTLVPRRLNRHTRIALARPDSVLQAGSDAPLIASIPMSQRSSVFSRLPLKVRRQLDQRLIAGGFGGYDALTKWLNGRGYRISKSALNRYGVELEHRERELALASAGKQAAVFACLAQEDGVSTTRGLLRLVQTETMMMLANHEGELDVDDLTRLARTVIDLARVALLQPPSPDQSPLPSTPPPADSEPDSDQDAPSGVSDPTIEVIRSILLARRLPPPRSPNQQGAAESARRGQVKSRESEAANNPLSLVQGRGWASPRAAAKIRGRASLLIPLPDLGEVARASRARVRASCSWTPTDNPRCC